MAKFKMSFKIQALELNIEGEREVVPEITEALKRQIGGLLAAPQQIAAPDGNGFEEKNITPTPPEVKTVKRKPRSGTRPAGETVATEPVDFRHDPSAWGSPQQAWKTKAKALWLLFVSEAQGGPSELSGSVIAATFNKHFRQAGLVTVGNVNRDLGVSKGKSPSPIGEDTTKSPSAWFLTEEGKKIARGLVAESKGKPSSSEAT